jgi:tetratricopeptide (TPR) repeat protein
MDDPDYPDSEKPKYWGGVDKRRSPTLAHPVQNVSWYDAVMFCNWLSRKEGRRICYKRVIDRAKGSQQFDSNQLRAVQEQIATISGDTDQKRQMQLNEYALLFQLGRYEESLAGFNALRERGVDDASVHHYRAVLLARSGNADAARESVERFVAGASDRVAASFRSSLSMIVESWLGNGQTALGVLNKDLEDHRSDGLFLYNAACACSQSSIAAAHHRNGELEVELKSMAVRLLREALDKGEDRDQLGTDPDLDPLRREAAFVGLQPARSEGDENWKRDFSSDGYRLPTEAEWEYACRAGTTTTYSFGDDAKWLDGYGICRADSAEACGSKLPNVWGLFDMHGNVWEWCDDVEGSSRVSRGGSWITAAGSCRSADRYRIGPSLRGNDNGFRVAIVPSSQ